MLTYDSEEDGLGQIERCLNDWASVQGIADTGRKRIGEAYSKARQWSSFEAIVGRL
jgi:hypothetical protein